MNFPRLSPIAWIALALVTAAYVGALCAWLTIAREPVEPAEPIHFVHPLKGN